MPCAGRCRAARADSVRWTGTASASRGAGRGRRGGGGPSASRSAGARARRRACGLEHECVARVDVLASGSTSSGTASATADQSRSTGKTSLVSVGSAPGVGRDCSADHPSSVGGFADSASAAIASAASPCVSCAPAIRRASSTVSRQRMRRRRGQRRRNSARGSSSSEAGTARVERIIAASARTVRCSARASHRCSSSSVATPTRSRVCAQESRPARNAVRSRGSASRRAWTDARLCTSRDERPRRSRAQSPSRAKPRRW